MPYRLNKGLVALAALVSLIVLVISALASSIAQPKPMTILDYYLALPQKYLRYAGGDSAKERSAALYINDAENAYLQARQPNGEFYSSLALFKRPDGSDLVAVENRECARGCNEEFYFLAYENGQWIDVTAKTLPVINPMEIRGVLEKQFKPREGFEPHIMHRLSSGGASIEVSEYRSGVHLGRLEWIGGEFVFKPLAAEATNVTARNVLASVSNAEGDRLEIIEVGPESPARLPLKGRLNIRVAYQLRSARACHIWALPVVLEERLPDEFTNGSMLYLQGSGELTTWFGFDNQAHLQQFKVVMADEQKKNLLTLNYNVDAKWEGVLECPAFHVECFPNDSSPNAPLACMVYPSGVQPGQTFNYNWSISAGTITSGQGTRRIILNTEGIQQRDVTAEAVISLSAGKCMTNASYTAPLGNAGKK
jgi:hypothetical protein